MLDKMYKYEMNSTRTVGATERTRDVGRADRQTDGQTDEQMDGLTEWTNIPPTTEGIVMEIHNLVMGPGYGAQ